jgi:NAD(P)-dependent dehydrogenase (short-subunit alcohol dehydrogenase family)
VGAATALKLAGAGADVVVNYRSKRARADEVVREIEALGRKSIALQADLTVESELAAMMARVSESFGDLDVLVLNASGGLEKGKSDDYAMSLNVTAQLNTAKAAAKLMTNGGRIVFVTSHWAHFYGKKAVMHSYEPVARSKHAGEQALREYASTVTDLGISLVVVSGDMIEGTITPRLLERKERGLMEARRHVATLPTVDEFADAIANAAADDSIALGHTVYVGSTDY